MSAGRILVVDDEADIRGLVKEVLTDLVKRLTPGATAN